MAKSGPIVIIEDDLDDQEILADVFAEMQVANKLMFFTNCPLAFTYLKTTTDQPFIILCDINLPMVNGLDFKKDIDADAELRQKSIPFIFFSTAASKQTVTEAYTQMTVQGFFKKENNFNEIKKAMTIIMNYWTLCKHPNTDT